MSTATVASAKIYVLEGLDYTVQVFLTNEPVEAPEDVAVRYDLRAGIEPLIADFKHGWGCGRVQTHVLRTRKVLAIAASRAVVQEPRSVR